MFLLNTKQGQRILVYFSPSKSLLVVGPTTDAITIPATVLRDPDRYNGVVLGWKDSEVRPAICGTNRAPLSKEWEQQGFVQAAYYGFHCLCLPLDETVATTSRQEKPCKQCKRNNDVGVSTCWLCGATNPTA